MLHSLITVRILLSGRMKRLPRNALAYMLSKPYPCLKCNRSYTNKSTLNRHLREECGKEPKLCPFCNKPIKQSSNLQRHIRTVHGTYIVWFYNLDNDSLCNLFHRSIDQSRNYMIEVILIIKQNEWILLNYLFTKLLKYDIFLLSFMF